MQRLFPLFRIALWLALICPWGISSLWAALFDPAVVYLTWVHEPETTMTVQWVTEGASQSNDLDHADSISYQEASKEGSGWLLALGKDYPLSDEKKYTLHRVELTHLTPNTDYRFKIGVNGKVYRFRTMPTSLTSPIRFVVGGDMYHDDIQYTLETNRQAATTDPLFALVGGDIAYVATHLPFKSQNIERWLTWLQAWKKEMVSPDGRLIPILAVIGNHDTTGFFDQTPAQAVPFYLLFRGEGQSGFRAVDFGSYLSIFLLDSGHTHSVPSQAEWLSNALKERTNATNKFAIYHVPAYPSNRRFNNKRSEVIRKYWVPLFEKYGIDIAFEHHDHTYKRTHPLLNNRINPNGVTYIGDGAWGVEKARTPNKKLFYLAKSAAERHFLLVTLKEGERHVQAITPKGQLIDELKKNLK